MLSTENKEFKPRSWQAPVQDLVQEYQAWDNAETETAQRDTEEVYRENSGLVAKGRLDPGTGRMRPRSSKAQKISSFVPSERYQRNFDRIRWA